MPLLVAETQANAPMSRAPPDSPSPTPTSSPPVSLPHAFARTHTKDRRTRRQRIHTPGAPGQTNSAKGRVPSRLA
eukprot:3550096-Prymnesium_polylepis.1